MGRRGPPPTPTRLKLLRGNPGGKPLPKNEPQPKARVPSCPEHLRGEAAKEWKRIAPILAKLGLVTCADRALLSAYCSSWALIVRAETELRASPLIEETKRGAPIRSPWLRIREGAVSECRQLAQEFGMSPAARTRINTVLAGEMPKDGKAADLDEIING